MNNTLRTCPRCFGRVADTAEACPYCGYTLVDAAPAQQDEPPRRPEPSPPGATPLGWQAPAAPPRPPPLPIERSEEIAAAGTEPLPWESRRKLGLWSSLWLTWRDSIFRPVAFFRRMPPRGGYGPALGYALVLVVIGLLFSSYWSVVESFLGGGQAQEGGSLGALAGSLIALLVALLLIVPLYVGFLFVAVAIIHVGFLVVGAGRRGYEATFRAVAYSSGPAAFAIFPFFGPLLSSIWGMVLIFISVREAQRTTNGRAALAFLVPLFAFLVFALTLALLVEFLVTTLELPVPA